MRGNQMRFSRFIGPSWAWRIGVYHSLGGGEVMGDGGEVIGIFRTLSLLGFYSVEGGWLSGGGVLQVA
jgi:hypothetical protein